MRERLSGIPQIIKDFWSGLSRVVRILIIGSAAGVLALLIILMILMNQKTYVLLYNDLSTTESTKVLATLNENAITPKVEPGGSIWVEENESNKARMVLASGGFPGSAFNYDTYNPGLTATQSDKNKYSMFQLQDRLQATIETMEEVGQAVVTISAPERDAFALRSDIIEPSASVMLVKRYGQELSAQQIQGIINIVRDSVPGLKEENISITDENGDMKAKLAVDTDANDTKLKLMQEVSEAARKRVVSVVKPRYGEGNVEVAVSCDLNTDDKVAEQISYQPFDAENPTRNPVNYTEHDRTKTDAPGGVAEGVAGANDNVGTPQYAEQEGVEANFPSYSSHDIYDYLVGSTKEQIVKNGLEITDMTVSVAVNAKVLPDGERDQIIALAANAAGVPVEKVTVQHFEFYGLPKAADPGPAGWETTEWILFGGLLLLAMIVIAATIIWIIAKRRKKADEEEEAAEEEIYYDEDGIPLTEIFEDEEEGEEDFEPITIVETSEQKLRAQIRDLAESDPEIVAQLIKTWLLSNN